MNETFLHTIYRKGENNYPENDYLMNGGKAKKIN